MRTVSEIVDGVTIVRIIEEEETVIVDYGYYKKGRIVDEHGFEREVW